MSVLRLSKNDIYKNGEDDRKIKLSKNQISYDSAMISGWETRNKESYNTLEKYHQRINSGGYLSADDLSSYRKALDIYADTSKGLRGLAKVFGQDMGDEQEWSDSISQLQSGYKGLFDYYSQWKTEDDYNAWYQKESFIKSYLEDPEKATTTMDYQENWVNEAKWRAKTKQILSAEDFKDNSGYVSTEQSGLFKPKYADTTYEIVNRNKEAWSQVASGQAWGKYSDRELSDLESFEHMTDEEIAIYNYLYAKGGWREGQAYLNQIIETLNYRKGSETAANIQSIDNDILRTLAMGAYGLSAGFDQFNSGLEQFFSSDKLPTSSIQFASTQIADSLDGFRKHAYNATTTIGNMAPSILVGTFTGGAGGAIAMGVSASGNAYGQALDMGYSKLQARAYSTLVGASEGALQYALGGITKLGGGTGGKVLGKIAQIDNSILRISAKLGWETVKEIGEEELQNFLEPAFRSIIFGEDYDAPTIDEIIETAVVTALSTGVLEGGSTIAGDVQKSRYYTNTYGNLQRDLVEQALEGGELANPLAQKYQQKLDNGRNLTGHQLGRLVEANEQQIISKDISSIQSAVENRLAELGETGDISTIAAALTKQAAGEKLSRAEQQAIANSKYGQRVSNELNPENIQSGDHSSAWAEQIGTKMINAEEYSRLVEAAQLPRETAETTGGQVVTEAPNTAQTRQAQPVPSSAEAATEIATGKESSDAQEEAVTLEDASQKYGAQAGAMVHTYRAGQDVAAYDRAYQVAYDMGKSGVAFSYIEKSPAVSYLTDSQKELAYAAGQAASNTEAQAQDARNKAKANGNTGRKKGVVKGESVTISDLKQTFNDTQGKAYKYLCAVAEATGVDIVLYRSKTNENGKFEGAQGRYRRGEPGTIYIDLNAGLTDVDNADDLGKYAMLRTFAHEFTHFIENWNPVRYNELRKVVFDTLTQRGENVNDLIEEKQAYNPNMSYYKASREVVAEAMTDILPDANFVQELVKKHKNIFTKLLEKLKEFLEKLKDYFNSLGGNPSREAKALKEQVGDGLKYVDSVVQLFDQAAVQAVENYQKTVATEDRADGGIANGTREETRDTFYRRANEAKYTIRERGQIACGYRPVSVQTERAGRTKNELQKLGIQVIVHEGLEANADGVTIVILGDSTSVAGDAVYVRNSMETDPVETAGHEAFHFWKHTEARVVYREVVEDNILFSSDAFVRFQEKIGQAYLGGEVEIDGNGWAKLAEEIYAYIAGMVHAGDSNNIVRPFLRDYDAVKAAWDALIEKQTVPAKAQGVATDKAISKNQRDESSDTIYGENIQYQQRTNTLTDREVLAEVSKQVDAYDLTVEEKSAFDIFQKRLSKLEDLKEQKREQQKALKRYQEQGTSASEIRKTQNRIETLSKAIDKASKELTETAKYALLQQVRNKALPVIEARILAERKARLEEYRKQYGTIPAGEKAVRSDALPKSTDGTNKVSYTARTVKGAGVTPDDFADLIDAEVAEGGLTYLPITNSDTTQKAIDYITEEGWEVARYMWHADVRAGKANAELSAIGALLLNNAAKAGDKTAWLEILHDYQMMGTNAGQAVQALSILKTLTPDDRLYMARKSVSRMVKDLRLKRKVQVDTELEAAYLAAETDEVRDAIMAQIQQDVADQIPATFKDKWTSLRYLNMLGNLRTQLRNLKGNAVMGLTVELKNLVAEGLETMAALCTGGKYQKTKAFFANKDLMKAAFADYAMVKSIVSNGGKYNDQMVGYSDIAQGVMEKRKIFKNKVLEKYRKDTNWAMENGDVPFSKWAYARALAGYLKQHGFSDSDLSKVDTKLLEEARTYAVQEAQEATFHDLNMLSKWVIKVGRRKDTPAAVRVIADGAAPFRQTPANIAVRAGEYSPLGVFNSLYYIVLAARSESDITPQQAINSWAKTITGSALFFAGWALAARGDLIGGPDDDEDKNRFEQMYGQQNYALKVGDTYITIDWASPAAIPMLMGAQFYKLIEENGFQFKDFTGALSSLSDPLIEMSMLQGINDTLEKVKYSDNNLIQIAINSSLSYLTQGLTNSLVGQLERSFEDSRMTTYVDENSQIPNWLQQLLGKASAKVPGWDYNQIPYINAWGEEQENPDLAVNAIYNMLSPSYISKDTKDAVYEELMRLDDAQDDKNVFPSTPSKEYEGRYLSAEEYVALAKAQGQTQRKLVEEIIATEEYKAMNDTNKAKSISFAYKYAKEKAQIDVLGREAFSAKWLNEIDGNAVSAIIRHVLEE